MARVDQPTPSIRNAADAFLLLHAGFGGADREWLLAVHLDGEGRPLWRETIAGDRSSLELPVPALLARALAVGARALLVAHNHPSGEARPSHADLRATRALADAARLLGLRLLDHLVFGANGHCVSLRHMRLL